MGQREEGRKGIWKWSLDMSLSSGDGFCFLAERRRKEVKGKVGNLGEAPAVKSRMDGEVGATTWEK